MLPVIGVPIFSKKLNGQDSLYSIVQMPAGIPVATVGIDNARNGALMAVQILALSDSSIMSSLEEFRTKLSEASRMKNQKVQEKLNAPG